VRNHQHKIALGRRRAWLARGLCALALAHAAAVEATWTAGIRPDPLTRQPRCMLTSEVQTTSDGYDATPVSLVFNGSSLLIVTESELDASFADLQLAVDGKPPIRDAKIARTMHLVFEQNIPELAQAMRSGRQITVYLRFWPTWPATQLFPVHFSLIGFSKAHDSLNQNCQPEAGTSRPAN
jgi:hypothetical protein